MRYTYVSAWSVIGGVNLPTDLDPQYLHQSQTSTFRLTKNPNKYLDKIDTGMAIANIALTTIFTKHPTQNFEVELENSLREIRSARQQGGWDTVLVAEGYGQASVSTAASTKASDFTVILDGVDKTSIKKSHSEELESMALALGFEADMPSSFEKIAEGIYFTDPDGGTAYSLSFSLSGRASMSISLSNDRIANISSRFRTIQSSSTLRSVRRLYFRMAEHENDPLRAFLFGWSALEILISKAFSEYEQEFMAPLREGPQSGLRDEFLHRVRDVMHGRYRLLDKFNCISAVLLANSLEQEVHADADRFESIKKIRDRILHGEAFNERELPVAVLATLLRKYVIAYLSHSTSC
jgi:hypothetical protein